MSPQVQNVVVNASVMQREVTTFGQRPGVKKGNKGAASLQEKHPAQTEILQEIQKLDSTRMVIFWNKQKKKKSPLPAVWEIWKIDEERDEHYHDSCNLRSSMFE